MKIQSLAIIFIIIILPITMVLSEYVNNKITTANNELSYDTKLLNSTYDAIKAFQLNTVNNAMSDVTTSKITDIEAAVNSFYNSLISNFNYTGYKSGVMKEYVPALVFTMYDGYYVYSPYRNSLTSEQDNSGNAILYDGTSVDNVSEDYADGKILNGLKPYVYYSCEYKKDNNNDVVITYTLDNYITIQGIIDGSYEEKSGYLIQGISESGNNKYKYDGIEFREDEKEELKEYIEGTLYSYVKINGTKYFWDDLKDSTKYPGADGKPVFIIDQNGTKNYNQVNINVDLALANQFYNAIFKNKSAYEYYKNAHDFTDWVEQNLGWVQPSYAVNSDYEFSLQNQSLFSSTNDSEYIYQKQSSYFEQHRREVIRNVVQTNLSTAIKGFSSAAGNDFIMPKISETDWDIIENDVCAISFLQGMNIGAKKYNGYSVVANTLTTEYVDENDIYILTKEGSNNTYSKANDKGLKDSTITIQPKNELGYYAGIWKLNCELKSYYDDSGITKFYYPIGYNRYGSYTSISGSSGLKETSIKNVKNIDGNPTYPDMYTYIETCNDDLRRVYYTALGRERWGSYHVNNVNYYNNSGNTLNYLLNAYSTTR